MRPSSIRSTRPALAHVVATAIAVGSFVASAPAAGLLDFETTPAGVAPLDNGVLSTPYAVPGGTARFFFDVNADNSYTSGTDVDPLFEHSGNDSVNGFVSTVPGVPDSARPGFEGQLGSFFLRQPGGFQFDVPGPFVIDYDTTTVIRELSGEIWDIDGTVDRGYEQWRVDALSASGTVLASQFSPQGLDPADSATLDSLPWRFALRNLPDGVDKLRMVYVGNKEGIGMALNNFSPIVAVPEPATLAAGVGALVMVGRRRWSGAVTA